MKIFSFANKLILFFSVFIFFVLAIVLIYSSSKAMDILEDQINKDLIAISEGTEGQIFLFFEKIKIQSANWSSDGFIRQQTEELVKTGNQNFSEMLGGHLLKNKIPLDSSVIVADILNTEMVIIASSDKKRVGVYENEHMGGKSKEELMGLSYGEVSISPVTLEQESEVDGGIHPKHPVFHSFVPIKSGDNKETIGFLLLHFSADNINKIVGGSFQVDLGALTGQEFIINQKTAEMFLVNKDGFMVTPSRFIEDSVLRKKIDNPATRACFDNKKEYSGSYIGYLGNEVQVASMCFIDYDVVLLTEVGTDEIFSSLAKERNNAAMIGFMAWFISVVMTYLFVRWILLRDIRIIGSVARDIIKGNFNIRANIKTKDEIGELATVFNQMLDTIKKSESDITEASKKLQEANKEIEKEKSSLEMKVHERTKELEDIKGSLQSIVREKTLELEKRVKDLEKFKKLTIGRELRMIELKDEIEILKKRIENEV